MQRAQDVHSHDLQLWQAPSSQAGARRAPREMPAVRRRAHGPEAGGGRPGRRRRPWRRGGASAAAAPRRRGLALPASIASATAAVTLIGICAFLATRRAGDESRAAPREGLVVAAPPSTPDTPTTQPTAPPSDLEVDEPEEPGESGAEASPAAPGEPAVVKADPKDDDPGPPPLQVADPTRRPLLVKDGWDPETGYFASTDGRFRVKFPGEPSVDGRKVSWREKDNTLLVEYYDIAVEDPPRSAEAMLDEVQESLREAWGDGGTPKPVRLGDHPGRELVMLNELTHFTIGGGTGGGGIFDRGALATFYLVGSRIYIIMGSEVDVQGSFHGTLIRPYKVLKESFELLE